MSTPQAPTLPYFRWALAAAVVLTLVVPVSAQELLFDEPQKLGSSVNTDAEESSPVLSRDGQRLYFSRAFDRNNVGGEFGGTDIWVTHREAGGKWQPASNKLNHWNNKLSNAVIGVSRDNQSVYLLNAYKPKSGIAFSKNIKGEWTDPEVIPVPGLTRSNYVGYYVHPSFNVIIISMESKESVGKEDLFITVKDSLGNWSPPTNLGLTVNTEGFEISPFLSEDTKRLYFSSDGHAGMGDADIFVSERLYNDSWTVWTKPRNLGNSINSPKFDAYFSIYGDSVCMFASNRDSERADIYSAKVRAKTVKPFEGPTQVYLDATEAAALFGPPTDLQFMEGLTELNQDHKKYINAIAQAMQKNKDVKCRLVAIRNSDRNKIEIQQARLLSILDYFKQLGVEGSRFIFGVEQASSATIAERETVVLRFYR